MYVRDVLSPTKYKKEPLTSMLNEKKKHGDRQEAV